MKIVPLATFSPPASTRAWQSTPHPTLPFLATSTDKSVRIYSLSSFQLHSTAAGGHKRSIRASAWQPGVKGEAVLATASFDSTIGIWRRWNDLSDEGAGAGVTVKRSNGVDSDDEQDDGDEEWRFTVILDGHDAEAKSAAFSAGGQFLATCSRDKQVWIWEELDQDNWETVAVIRDHDGDVKCVAWHPREDLMASCSYDDQIRLYKEDSDDWVCCTVLKGHESTVWYIAFEPQGNKAWLGADSTPSEAKKVLLERREERGPRLISCSDDKTIRIWSRKGKAPQPSHSTMPSIIRTSDFDEEWFEQVQLPKAHDLAIFAISWSPISGRVVSTGSDGRIVVYEEQWDEEHVPNSNGDENGQTKWVIVAQVDGSHGIYEANHVCWTKRRDSGKRMDNDEMIITTGDDGEVKAWILET